MTEPIGRRELRAYAERSFFGLEEEELDTFEELVGEMLEGVARFEGLPDPPRRLVAAERRSGRRPRDGEDPLNAIVRWCSVRAEEVPGDAPLAGVRVGLKDMFAIAGLPLGFGSSVLEGYVSDEDAEVTARLLEAGAEIVAVTNMESFAFSAGGETTATGPVLNPFDLSRTACGSSSGSAAALFYDGIDLAFGTDQGGSIRIPASWCGVLGLKPTHGLVPYTGTIPADWRFDHAGPMARETQMLARGLDAVAEEHTFDPLTKTLHSCLPGTFLDAVDAAAERLDGIRLGVLVEGFAEVDDAAPPGTAETNRAVGEAVERLRELGAEVVEISVPAHRSATDIMFVALAESITAAQRGASGGHAWWTRDLPHLKAGLGEAIRARGNELPDMYKVVAILGHHLLDGHFGSYGARAHAMAAGMRRTYDAALRECDFLVMPTTTHYAHRVAPDASRLERVRRGITMLANSGSFNLTGHPAISLPAAAADGLPVGVQLVAPWYGDADLLGLARTYEREHGWLPAAAPVRAHAPTSPA